MEHPPRVETNTSRAERGGGVLWSWWFWALILAFIVWSAAWGWGPDWGGWWSHTGGKTTAQLLSERQHEPPPQQRQENEQELHW